MVYAQPRIFPVEWDVQSFLGVWDKNRSPNHSQTTWPSDSQKKKKKKKRTCWIVHFSVLADHRVKLKESKKRDKYIDFAREQRIMENKGDCDINCNWWSQSPKD